VIADARLTGRLARRTGARATILHVLSQVPMIFGRGVGPDRITEVFAATGAPEMKHMQAAVAELATHRVEAEIKVRIGLVVEEILDELATGGYDLLVVGAHRSNGLVERLLLENVTADIVPQSPVPVLVVKGTGGPPAPPYV
jgi:nucleotide-binding universal stress UspA family protein